MKKFSRIVSLFLALAIIFSLAACGKKPEQGENPHNDNSEPETEQTETVQPVQQYVEVSREGSVEKIPVRTVEGVAAEYKMAMATEYFTFSSDGEYDTYSYDAWEGSTRVYYCVYPYQGTTAQELAEGLERMYGGRYENTVTEKTVLGKNEAIEVCLFDEIRNKEAQMRFFLVDTDYGCLVIEMQFVSEMYEGLFDIMLACFETLEIAESENQGNNTEHESDLLQSPELADIQKKIADDGEIFGVAYLGYYDGGFDTAIEGMKKEGFWDDFCFIGELTEDRCILSEGAEWYVVVPVSRNAEISVYEYYFDYDKDYIEGVNPGAGREYITVSDGMPVLLRGNISDIMPNLLVEARTAGGEMVKYTPCLSLENGRLDTFSGGVSDITPYDRMGMFAVDPQPDAVFCGTWKCYEGNGNDDMYALVLTLNPDGIAEYKYGYPNSDALESFTGTWTLDGDMITLDLIGGPVEFENFYDKTICFKWEIDNDPQIDDIGLIVRHISDSSPFVFGGEGAQYWMMPVRE